LPQRGLNWLYGGANWLNGQATIQPDY